MLNNKIILLSDLHGKTAVLAELLEKYDHIIQNGDFSYDYECLDCISPEQVVINYGNHESHDQIKNYPHFLSPYGLKTFGVVEFFNIAGAFSIDWKVRVEKELSGEWMKSWFPEEELHQHDLDEALRQYKGVCPELVISHEAPRSVANLVGDPDMLLHHGFGPEFTTRTSETLERMFNAFAPKVWYFSHYHKDFDHVIRGCRFICQEECKYIEVDKDLNIVYPEES